MDDARRTCPRCGERLNYDAATGLYWCPNPGCEFAEALRFGFFELYTEQEGGEAQASFEHLPDTE